MTKTLEQTLLNALRWRGVILDYVNYLVRHNPYDFPEVLDISLFSFFSIGAGDMITVSSKIWSIVGAKPPPPPTHPLQRGNS